MEIFFCEREIKMDIAALSTARSQMQGGNQQAVDPSLGRMIDMKL